MIRVDAVWLAVQPLDMGAGTETALARVVDVFGTARPHRAHLFAYFGGSWTSRSERTGQAGRFDLDTVSTTSAPATSPR